MPASLASTKRHGALAQDQGRHGFVHLLQQAEDAGDREQAEQGRDQRDAADQPVVVEHEPHVAGDRVLTDQGHRDAEQDADQTLDHVLAGERGDQGKPRHGDPENLGRPQEEGGARQRRREEHQHQGAERAAHGAREQRGVQRLLGLALLGQGRAVEGRAGGAGGARRVDQDGRDRAAVFRRHVDGGQHDQPLRGLHGEGERQKQRDPADRRQAGQRADDQPGDRADQDDQQMGQLQIGLNRVQDLGRHSDHPRREPGAGPAGRDPAPGGPIRRGRRCRPAPACRSCISSIAASVSSGPR